MKPRKISVVIPVYNSADCIHATLNSLACQTMPAEDFEIICVNDCSTDNSKEVIERYAEKMSNIVLINLEKNSGGPMVPRNKAIEIARGRYIQFLDNDDFLGEEALERFYNMAEKCKSDVIFGRFVGVNGRSVPKIVFEKGNLPKADLFSDKVIYSLGPHKMARTAFLKENGIQFHTEAKTIIEDQWFAMQCYIKAKVITVLADYDYYFIVNRGDENMSRRLSAPDRFFFIPHEIMRFANEQVLDSRRNKKIKSLYINRFFRTASFQAYLFDTKFPAEDRRQFLEKTKEFMDVHFDDEMIELSDQDNLDLIEALRKNNFTVIEMLGQRKAQKKLTEKKPEGDLVMLRRASINTYIRPSVNSPLASPLDHYNKPFRTFYCIDGWLEVRQPDSKGGTFAVFVRQDDVRFPLSSRVQKMAKHVKGLLKGSRKPSNTYHV